MILWRSLHPTSTRSHRFSKRGLREVNAASQAGFTGLAEVLEVLASLPEPEEVLALRPAPALEERVQGLLAKNRAEGLNEDEEREWERYEYLEHLVRMAKGKSQTQAARSLSLP